MVPTYEDIRRRVAKKYEKGIRTCWIAEVKRKHGLTRGPAWNTGQGRGAPPCPPDSREAIECVLREYGAI